MTNREELEKRKYQGITYCRPEIKAKIKGLKQRTSKRYCPECKMKIRGKNHQNGEHHKAKIKKVKKD